MAEVRLSPAAQRDLEGIFEFSVQHWGVLQALRHAQAIADACATLAEQPGLGASCDGVRVGYRVCRVERHRIYFRATSYGIAVIRILHERMEPSRHLR